MGPRFCKRGNLAEREPPSPPPAPLQWGHAFVSVETSAVASPKATNDALQWGHAFVSVETRKRIIAHAARIRLQWGHAFVSVETSAAMRMLAYATMASMGPRFCKRGNLMLKADTVFPSRLQWGHAFVSVETASRTVGQVYHLSSPLRPEVVRQAHILAG